MTLSIVTVKGLNPIVNIDKVYFYGSNGARYITWGNIVKTHNMYNALFYHQEPDCLSLVEACGVGGWLTPKIQLNVVVAISRVAAAICLKQICLTLPWVIPNRNVH